jgi:hypothetical protein
MNMNLIKRLISALILSVGGFLTLPAYAWPDVDHMNMCGAPAKTVRAYSGSHQGWDARDNYISARGMAYYFRTMCPETKAVKMKNAVYKKPAMKNVTNEVKEAVKDTADKKQPAKEVVVEKTIEKSTIRTIKKRSTYNHKLDCARVDNLNETGAIVRVIRRR